MNSFASPTAARTLRRSLLALTVFSALLLGPLIGSGSAAKRGVVGVSVVTVGDRGNQPTAVVPFTDAIYPSCSAAPSGSTDCVEIGAVPYQYQIGELEITVRQWVKFLNTVDPRGTNSRRLFEQDQRPFAWPQYGQIRRARNAPEGEHYKVASEAWADKPFGFADFLGAARLVNSLYNGSLLRKSTRSSNGLVVTTYTVLLSPETETGMYDMKNRSTTRLRKRGFVIPSQNEWVKAAYFDSAEDEYWKYPTNPGVYGDGSATAPTPTSLDYSTGNVVNQEVQPLANFKQSELPPPAWCPVFAQTSPTSCSTQNPIGMPPQLYEEAFTAGLSSVGQALTRSPWGTLDQGGNAVEWTDTITPPPAGISGERVWRRLHGGIANAPAYQMWPSAVGLQPQNNVFYKHVYPWLGIRVGVIGAISPGTR